MILENNVWDVLMSWVFQWEMGDCNLLSYSIKVRGDCQNCLSVSVFLVTLTVLAFCSLTSSSALSFTCVWYCAIVTAGMGYILLIQLLNISYNVTEREARIALRENSGRRLLCGMAVDPGQYNRGFLRNWIQFIFLGSLSLQYSSEAIV